MMKKDVLFKILITVATTASLLFSRSCANTTTPPQGGVKDTIPPVLVDLQPMYNGTEHFTDTKNSEVVFVFDEYVRLNEPNKYIFLSPPQSKPPKAKLKGKKVVVTFEEPLLHDRTYSLSLGESIKDNNEGNTFPPFTHSFSTGACLDTLFVSGTVQEASTMLPLQGLTILFHTDLSDSAVFKRLPAAAAKSDKWGYFTVRNLPADSVYRVYAIEDINNNNRYDPEMEKIAFLDSLLTPTKVMHFDDPELVATDMKDTVKCLSRPSQIYLSLFREISDRQFLRDKGRVAARQMFLSFSAPHPRIDSIYIPGIEQDRLLFEYDMDRDSIVIWINEQGAVQDTLRMIVNYMRTDDSLKTLVSASDTLKMIHPKRKYRKDRYGRMVEIRDTVSQYKVTANAENIDQDGIQIRFSFPMIRTPFDSVRIVSVNTRQQESLIPFTVERDSLDIKKYTLRPKEQMQKGYEYVFKFPGKQFMDINGLYCDSLDKKYTLPQSEDLSSLTLEMTGVSERYIVELVDERRAKVFRKYEIDTDTDLFFPYLNKGKYSIRVTQDKNRNGRIDTGSLLAGRQPEKVMMYRANSSVGNKAYILDIPERVDLVQTIDLAEMFR